MPSLSCFNNSVSVADVIHDLVPVDWYYYLVASTIALTGLLLTFIGHKAIKMEMLIMGMLPALLISTIVFTLGRVDLTGTVTASHLILRSF